MSRNNQSDTVCIETVAQRIIGTTVQFKAQTVDKQTVRHKTTWIFRILLLAIFATSIATPVFADATLFAGPNQTPTNRPSTGASLGLSLLFVGFEFEHAVTPEDRSTKAPSLKTSMFNVLVQTPFSSLAGLQFYATAGGGLYREQLMESLTIGLGSNFGGGVKVPLTGPFRLRLDYRLFSLKGSALHPRPQRIYAGLNVSF